MGIFHILYNTLHNLYLYNKWWPLLIHFVPAYHCITWSDFTSFQIGFSNIGRRNNKVKVKVFFRRKNIFSNNAKYMSDKLLVKASHIFGIFKACK